LDSITDLSVPEILANIPPKLLPIITKINEYRYFLIEGGRGGGKSQTVGRFLLYIAEKLKVRIVCGREIQNTIQESVYTLLSELVLKYNLNFEVTANKIIHRETNSTFNFRGFREQGAINIQGMEGVDIVWIDEAQGITKLTLDALIPTIRKEKAKIFFTMNRFEINDPVYNFCANKENCLHIEINYTDNPQCPKALIQEAEECKDRFDGDYDHIWLGEPYQKTQDGLLNYDLVHNSPFLQFLSQGTSRIIMAIDVARFGEDKTVFTVLRSYNIQQWEQIFQEAKQGWDLMQTCGRILDLKKEFRPSVVVVDDTGVGGGVTDRLNELRTPITAFNGGEKAANDMYYNKRDEGYFRLQDYFLKGKLKILNDADLIDQLLALRFKYKSSGSKTILSKDDMRKQGLRSPDKADALMMAIYYCERAFKEEIAQSYSQQNREAISEYSVLNY
jgi:phage terminase large subunit